MAKIKTIPSIDYTKCTACKECITFCPFGCLDLLVRNRDVYGNVYPALSEKGLKECTSCGICAKKCPIGIIEMVEEAG